MFHMRRKCTLFFHKNIFVSLGKTNLFFPSTENDESDAYINSLNDIDMDNLSRSNSNVTLLDNKKLANDKGNDESVLVTWNGATVPEDWWSVCQLPVFLVLFAIVGVLAVSFVVSNIELRHAEIIFMKKLKKKLYCLAFAGIIMVKKSNASE